jgi:hypothetical protein
LNNLRVRSGKFHSLAGRIMFTWMYNGVMPHDRLMKMIEVFWTQVLRRVANPR